MKPIIYHIDLANANAEIKRLKKEIIRLRQQSGELRDQLKVLNSLRADLHNAKLESERQRGIIRDLRDRLNGKTTSMTADEIANNIKEQYKQLRSQRTS